MESRWNTLISFFNINRPSRIFYCPPSHSEAQDVVTIFIFPVFYSCNIFFQKVEKILFLISILRVLIRCWLATLKSRRVAKFLVKCTWHTSSIYFGKHFFKFYLHFYLFYIYFFPHQKSMWLSIGKMYTFFTYNNPWLRRM